MSVIIIGRTAAEGVNCVLAGDDSVSRKHAEIIVDADGGHATVRDLGSSNGTYVNNQRIFEPRTVGLRDELRFGRTTLTLAQIISRVQKPAAPAGSAAGSGAVTHSRPAPGASAYVCGRDGACDVVFTGAGAAEISKRHARLSRDAQGGVVIEDLGSTNGTYVNGQRITGARALRRGDAVMLANRYRLAWEPLFPASAPAGNPVQPRPKRRSWVLTTLLPIAAVIIIAVGGFFVWKNYFSEWTREKTFDTYKNSVCLVVAQYGYIIKDGDEDITAAFVRLYGGPDGTDYIHLDEDGDMCIGPAEGTVQGTGFFISNDGKIATNLHVAAPWMATNARELLQQQVRKALAEIGYTMWPDIKVEGVLVGIGVIPNSLPFAEANLVECSVYRKYDTLEKDVAIIQTATRSLPAKVATFVDVDNAATGDDALKEGKRVYTIGFPYGVDLAMNDQREIHDQIHEGSITQKRGEYDFGHDAAVTHGASGSPIFDNRGRLVGIVNAGLENTQGFNIGIKARYLVELLNR